MATLTNLISNATGNVGIGTTSTDAKLQVYSTTGTTQIFNQLQLTNMGVGNNGDIVGIGFAAGESTQYGVKGSIGFVRTTSYGRGDITFYTNNTAANESVSTSNERMRITSGGSVLIGVNGAYNSSRLLQVKDGLLIGNSYYTYASIDTNSTADLILSSNANPANLGSNSNIIFKLGTSAGGGPDEKMRIVSNGNVGIGTTAPAYKLDVSTSIVSRSNISTPRFSSAGGYVYGITNSPTWNIGNGSSTNNNATAPDGTTSAGTYTLSATSALLFDLYQTISGLTNGRVYTVGMWVKLGTATNFCLVVNNTQAWNTIGGKAFTSSDGLSTSKWTHISYTFAATATGAINLHLGYNLETGVTQQTAGTVFLWNIEMTEFSSTWIGNVEDEIRLPGSSIWTSRGNVGIGTTSPSAKLDVSGSAIRSFITAGSTEPGFIVDYPSSNGYGAFFVHVNNTRRWRIGSVGDTNVQPALNFWQEGTGSRMIINNVGRVGMGTTSPSGNLDVVSSDSTTTYIRGASSALRFLAYADGTNWIQSGTSTSNSSADLIFSSMNGSSQWMRIQGSSGNVGIGTSSPTQKLHVVGNVLSSYNILTSVVKISSASDAASYISVDGYTAGLSYAGTYIGLASLVGFGVAANLYIGGGFPIIPTGWSGTISGIAYANATSLASSVLLQTSTDGSTWTTRSQTGAINGTETLTYSVSDSATPLYVRFTLQQSSGGSVSANNCNIQNIIITNLQSLPNKSSISNRFLVDGSGNVGIGTTSPASKLHISGSGQTIMRLDSSTTTNISQFMVKANTDGVLVMGMSGGSAASTSFGVTAAGQAYIGTTTLSTVHPTSLVIGNVSTIPIVFSTANTEKARITSGGSLLVGTTVAAANTAGTAVATNFKGINAYEFNNTTGRGSTQGIDWAYSINTTHIIDITPGDSIIGFIDVRLAAYSSAGSGYANSLFCYGGHVGAYNITTVFNVINGNVSVSAAIVSSKLRITITIANTGQAGECVLTVTDANRNGTLSTIVRS